MLHLPSRGRQGTNSQIMLGGSMNTSRMVRIITDPWFWGSILFLSLALIPRQTSYEVRGDDSWIFYSDMFACWVAVIATLLQLVRPSDSKKKVNWNKPGVYFALIAIAALLVTFLWNSKIENLDYGVSEWMQLKPGAFGSPTPRGLMELNDAIYRNDKDHVEALFRAGRGFFRSDEVVIVTAKTTYRGIRLVQGISTTDDRSQTRLWFLRQSFTERPGY